MFKKILYCLVVSFFFIPVVFSNSIQAEHLAERIKEYINDNIPLTEQFPVYNTVRNNIKELIISTDSSQTEKKQLLKDLAFYHNNNILELVRYITSREGATQRFKDWKKEGILELQNKESEARKKYNISDDTLYLSSNNELVRDDDIYMLTYTTGGNILIFKDGVGLQSISNISYERKIPFYEIIQEGASKFLLYSDSFFLEDGYFQTYEYSQYYPVNTTYGVYKSDFISAGFDFEDAVFLRLQDAVNNVTIKPEKVLLFPESYLTSYGENEREFINTSVIDVLRTDKNYEKTYKNIIETAQNITRGITDEQEKIEAIYSWMVQNVRYPQEYDVEDYKIFSGLEAFENGSAVCSGQVSLMYYLLKLAGVEDVEHISGFVVDAEDFPTTRHKWIQIGNYFYDPAFEKVYQSDAQEYLYYKIPYDIIYTNRYNTRNIPEGYSSLGKDIIEKEIKLARYELTNKYNASDGYQLLEDAFFRKQYSIPAVEAIGLKHILPYLEKYEYKIQNGKPTQIMEGFKKEIEYYPIASISESIEAVLIENDYDISGYVILEIYDNGNFKGYGLTDSLK